MEAVTLVTEGRVVVFMCSCSEVSMLSWIFVDLDI